MQQIWRKPRSFSQVQWWFFSSSTSSTEVATCLNHIKQIYTETECNGLNENPEFCLGRQNESKEEGDGQEDDLEKTLRHIFPFYKFFNRLCEELLTKCSDDPKFVKNPYYCPRFIEYILEQKMPFFTLWSGRLIEQFGIIRDTNATVENYFKYVKFWMFKEQLRIVATRFVRKMEEIKEIVNS